MSKVREVACLLCGELATHGDFCLRHHHLPVDVKAWAKKHADQPPAERVER